MLEIVTGISLAAAAGLNAYVPLLGLGLLAKFTGLVSLPLAWSWLENSWSLGILGGLLAIEVLVDKIPALDTVNDVIQTAVRPASGGIVFSAGATSNTAAVSHPGEFVTSAQLWPFVVGVLIALIPHIAKLIARPVINFVTAGVGASVASTLEDIAAVIVTILAVVVPVVALILLVISVVLGVRWLTKRRARKLAAASPAL